MSLHEDGDLQARYAPGEDAEPLARAVLGGLLGGIAALGLDRLVGGPGPDGWFWPAALADVVHGDPTALTYGASLALVVASLGGILFAYGQVRRFVPGPPWAAGVVFGLAAWVAAAPALLPHAAAWLATDEALVATGQAAVIVVETLLGALLGGALIGITNPPRHR